MLNSILKTFCWLYLVNCSVAKSEDYLFINQQQGSALDVYHAETLNKITSIPTLEGPAGIVVSDKNNWLAISYPEAGMISFIDNVRFFPLEHIDIGGSPFGLALAGDKLFYSDWHRNEVGVIDPVTGKMIKKIGVGKAPAGLIVMPCHEMVVVANRESNSVSVIDIQRLMVVKEITVGEGPFALAEDGKLAYVVNTRSNNVSVIDLTQGKEIKRLNTGRMPYGIAVDVALQKLYVTNQLENSVEVISIKEGKTLARLSSGAYPENIALDEKKKRLYVLNWFDATLSMFNTQNQTELKRVDLPEASRAFGRFLSTPQKRTCQ